MKRFAFWFVLALLAIAWLRSEHRPPRRPPVVVRHVANGHGRSVYHVEQGGQRVVFVNERGAINAELDDDGSARVAAEGLPVPVVPGTRVTEARIEPPAPSVPPRPAQAPKAHRLRVRLAKPPAPPKPPKPLRVTSELRVAEGRLSATEERARNDARVQLERDIARMLEPDVPGSWKVPARMIDGMVREIRVKTHDRDYGTMYAASIHYDFSPARRSRIIKAYRHEQVAKRITVLGGALGFVLTCLAAVSGYIKADEATKGYYTDKLRLAAAAGVGAAGVVIYRMLG